MKKTLLLFLLSVSLSTIIQAQVVSLDRTLTSWPDAEGHIVIPDTVESINGYVFYNNKNIKSVVIPSSVKLIGIYAFYNCDSLTRIYNGEGITLISNCAFTNCLLLDSIQLSNSIKTISSSAFSNCESLRSIHLPDKLTTISDYCFYNCTNLQKVQFGDSLRYVNRNAFGNCKTLKEVILGNAVSLIGQTAFANCTSLMSVKLGSNQSRDKMEILSFEESPFYGCPIQDLELNKNVKFNHIQSSCFKNLSSLKTVTVGDSVTDVPVETFLGCTGLRFIRLSKTVRTVGNGFLQGCSSIDSITVDSANTFFSSYEGALLNKSLNKLLYYPANRDGNFELPLSVDTIGDYAFSGAKKITELYLPNSVTLINKYAFSGCTGLKTLEIGRECGTAIPKASIQSTSFDQCTSISYIRLNKGLSITGNSPFMGLPSLDSVSIGKRTDYINGELFNLCTALKKVSIGDDTCMPGDTITSDSNVFPGCTSLRQAYLNLNIGVSGYYFNNLFSMIDSLTIGPSVTFIGYKTFSNNKRLRSLRIPNNVTYLGNSAFKYCDSLRYVILSDSLKYLGKQCFYYCTSLKFIRIPTKIHGILDGTFDHCSSLDSVSLEEGITDIEYNAFYECKSLTHLDLPKSLKTIGSYAFGNCTGLKFLNLPNSVTTLNSYVFSGCINLTKLHIGSGLSTIPSCAFSDCTSLDTLIIPNTITMVGIDAFSNCTGLKKIIIGDPSTKPAANIINFGAYPFPGCTNVKCVEINRDFKDSNYSGPFVNMSSITSAKIADIVTLLPTFAFYGCTSLEAIDIPNSVKYIGPSAFIGCGKLTAVKFPDQLTTIKSNMFGSCTSMKQFHLPESIITIEDYGFGGCNSMDSLILPNQVKIIGYGAFRMCSSLRYVYLPKSMTIIGERAFDECTTLNELWSKNPIPPSANINCFLKVPTTSCILHVPKGSRAAYKNAEQWKLFTNIQEFESVDVETASVMNFNLIYFSDKIVVSTTNTLAIEVCLTNLHGHHVWKGTLDGSLTIPTSQLPSGMYLLNGAGLREKIVIR